VTAAHGFALAAVPLSGSVAPADGDAAAVVPETDGGLGGDGRGPATQRAWAAPAARRSSLPPGLLSSSRTGSRLSAHPGDGWRSPPSHERSQQEEDTLHRSLTILAAAAALPMVAGALAAARTPDAPPTPPGEARPATLAELDAACLGGRQPACAAASKMRSEILSGGFLVPDPPPMATGGGAPLSKERPEPPPPPPPPPILMPGP